MGETGPSITLAELSELSTAARCRAIVKQGEDELRAAIEFVRENGVSAPHLDADRLAWAVAFNIGDAEGRAVPVGADTSRQRQTSGRSYLSKYDPTTSLGTLWTRLSRTIEAGDGAWSLLGELALSVACEQREDWQPPESQPVDKAAARSSVALVFVRDYPRTVNFIQSKFRDRSVSAEDVAADAWGDAIADFWSEHAKRRFLGLSRISTLICQLAYFKAVDRFRKHQRRPCLDEQAIRSQTELGVGNLLESVGVTAEPDAGMITAERNERIRQSLSMLTAKQRLVAEMYWLKGIDQYEIAKMLNCSQANVNHLLQNAKEGLRASLGEYPT